MRWIRRRSVTNRVRWAIDNLLPPIVSDSRWFNWILARVMFGDRLFDLDFKEKALSMTSEDLETFWNESGKWEPYRESDTTPDQVKFVMEAAEGPRILEIGCGNGRLAARLAEMGFEVTACDLRASWIARLEEEFARNWPNLRFQVANAERLPWPDVYFNTVVSTHTLEHIPNLAWCLQEIRRVARRRIVIVVPCQRYRRYTVDTHINFFPTEAVLRWSLKLPPGAFCKKIDGDWAVDWKLVDEVRSGEQGVKAQAVF